MQRSEQRTVSCAQYKSNEQPTSRNFAPVITLMANNRYTTILRFVNFHRSLLVKVNSCRTAFERKYALQSISKKSLLIENSCSCRMDVCNRWRQKKPVVRYCNCPSVTSARRSFCARFPIKFILLFFCAKSLFSVKANSEFLAMLRNPSFFPVHAACKSKFEIRILHEFSIGVKLCLRSWINHHHKNKI